MKVPIFGLTRSSVISIRIASLYVGKRNIPVRLLSAASFSFRSSPYNMTPPAEDEEKVFLKGRSSHPFACMSVENIKDGQCRKHLHTTLSTVLRRAAIPSATIKNEIRKFPYWNFF
jgi:hypothetical protein